MKISIVLKSVQVSSGKRGYCLGGIDIRNDFGPLCVSLCRQRTELLVWNSWLIKMHKTLLSSYH